MMIQHRHMTWALRLGTLAALLTSGVSPAAAQTGPSGSSQPIPVPAATALAAATEAAPPTAAFPVAPEPAAPAPTATTPTATAPSSPSPNASPSIPQTPTAPPDRAAPAPATTPVAAAPSPTPVATPPAEGQPISTVHPMESTAQRAPRRIVGIHFDEHSGWAVGLEGYAGLATYSNSEGTKAHAMSGAVLRFRWQYFEVNGVIETSDYMNERWHSLGGSVGAFLPFTNWVDFDASIGLIARNYLTTDRLFGENGASVDSKALTLRFGVSDRPFDTLISPRLGAALVMAYDLKQHDVPWNYDVGNRLVASGVSKFGGFTAGVVMCLGLDLSVRDD